MISQLQADYDAALILIETYKNERNNYKKQNDTLLKSLGNLAETVTNAVTTAMADLNIDANLKEDIVARVTEHVTVAKDEILVKFPTSVPHKPLPGYDKPPENEDTGGPSTTT